MPKLSVIIPTYHRNDLLALCLERLASGKQTLAFNDYEVIVSDDGQHTTAEAMIAKDFPWVRWVAGPKRGPAANRNYGAKHAKGDWLVFTDDDCLPDPQWLESYQKVIQHSSDSQVFEGRTYADRKQSRLNEEAPLNEQGGYLWSCNFAIEAHLFWMVDGFDESYPFPAMEDVDLNHRILKAGKLIEFVPEASVCHPWRKHGGVEKFRKLEASITFYLEKHPEEEERLNTHYYLVAVKNHVLQSFNKWHFKDHDAYSFFLAKLGHLARLLFRSLRYT